MDREYAQLSLKCGMFAGEADDFLDNTYFSTKVRAAAWSLTPEKFAEWQREAEAMGVPPFIIDPEMEALLPELIEQGLRLQEHIDFLNPQGKVR